MYDLIIKNGWIVDGSGSEKYIADVAILDDKIIKIGNLEYTEGKLVIDAQGKIVCPGFIDPHSHADVTIMFYPQNESCILQGVTTFIGGNCGDSAAPVGEYWDNKVLDLDKIKGVIPSYYTWYNSQIKSVEVKKQAKEQYGLDLNYETLGQFCLLLEKMKISSNYYPLVGHGNLRNLVMKNDVNRPATSEEVEKMKLLLEDALMLGARGLSTGLDYPPGAFATTEEIIELAKVVKKYDGIYASHIRARKLFTTGEGGYDPEGGLQEAFLIGEKTGVKVHISHLIMIKNPEYTIELFRAARDKGINVTYDVIANTTAGGGTFTYLAFILKPWYLTAGTPEQFEMNLRDSDYVEAMKKDMSSSKWYFANFGALPGVEDAILITHCKNSEFENKTVKSIMEENGWTYSDTLINIAKSDSLTRIKYGTPSKETEHELLKELYAFSGAMPSSDGFAVDDKACFGFAAPFCMYPHQNSYNYAIRYLKRYLLESLEKSIYKATGLVAETFGIANRGFIKENCFADIIVVDLDSLDCNENIFDSRTYPSGVDYVVVNGLITSNLGEHTGEKAGRVLRK